MVQTLVDIVEVDHAASLYLELRRRPSLARTRMPTSWTGEITGRLPAIIEDAGLFLERNIRQPARELGFRREDIVLYDRKALSAMSRVEVESEGGKVLIPRPSPPAPLPQAGEGSERLRFADPQTISRFSFRH